MTMTITKIVTTLTTLTTTITIITIRTMITMITMTMITITTAIPITTNKLRPTINNRTTATKEPMTNRQPTNRQLT